MSDWGLLIAIAALGLGISLTAIFAVGWRHYAIFAAATLAILGSATAWIIALQL